MLRRDTFGCITLAIGTFGLFAVMLVVARRFLGPSTTRRDLYLWALAGTMVFLLLMVLALRLLRFLAARQGSLSGSTTEDEDQGNGQGQ